MTFGSQVDIDEAGRMVEAFARWGGAEIDTAYVYNEGETERILGRILEGLPAGSLRVATKVNPRVTGKLDRASILDQCNKSLDRLRLESVDVLYLHFPDPETPLEVTLAACDELYQAGKIRELGLSNFPAWVVVHMWHLCDSHAWLRPTVYQGLYNAISRKLEPELVPALRRLGLRLYAYNPLAGGLLTGKHASYDAAPSEGRFSLRESYRKRYWKEPLMAAVADYAAACREADITPTAAALRWLAYRSRLDPAKGDAVIVGASSLVQLEENLRALSSDNIAEPVVKAIETAWERARPDSPEYFRTHRG